MRAAANDTGSSDEHESPGPTDAADRTEMDVDEMVPQ